MKLAENNTRARGVYKGCKAAIDPAKIKQMKADAVGPSAIAKTLKIGRASVQALRMLASSQRCRALEHPTAATLMHRHR
jgi:hypothetical protein